MRCAWFLTASLALCSACDTLFALETVAAPADSRACGTADEDADGIPDLCDVCPGTADATQDDADSDGVGDACDPNASQQNVLAHFDGFNIEDLAQDRWQPFADSIWTFEDGVVRHDGSDTVGELQYVDAEPATEVSVEIGFTFGSWSVETSAAGLGIRFDAATMTLDGVLCQVDPYGADDSFQAVNTENRGGGDPIAPVTADQDVVVRGTRTLSPDLLRCSLFVNGANEANKNYTDTIAFPPAGHVAIYAPYTTATVRYVAVYRNR